MRGSQCDVVRKVWRVEERKVLPRKAKREAKLNARHGLLR